MIEVLLGFEVFEIGAIEIVLAIAILLLYILFRKHRWETRD